MITNSFKIINPGFITNEAEAGTIPNNIVTPHDVSGFERPEQEKFSAIYLGTEGTDAIFRIDDTGGRVSGHGIMNGDAVNVYHTLFVEIAKVSLLKSSGEIGLPLLELNGTGDILYIEKLFSIEADTVQWSDGVDVQWNDGQVVEW